MKSPKVLISAVLSLLVIFLFFGICQAGELDEVGLMQERNNPFLPERWDKQTSDQIDYNSFLPDTNVTYVSSILWTGVVDAQVVGNYAYCAFVNGLVILDVSDPANPTFVSRLYFQTGGFRIFIDNGRAYLVNLDGYLIIIDVSKPANPDSIGSYFSGYAYDVFVRDSLAYVASGNAGLKIIGVSNPALPSLIGSCNTPGFAMSVFVNDSLAYIADGDSGLQIIRISDPASPSLLGRCNTPDWAYGIFVLDSLAYIADQDSGLQVIRISNPVNPGLVSAYKTPGMTLDVFVQNTFAYIVQWYSPWRLQIIDVSNPYQPDSVGSYLTYVNAVVVRDSIAYVAARSSGFKVILVSNPANPSLKGSYNTPGLTPDVFVKDNVAYVANGNSLKIFDVINPATPESVGTCVIPGWPNNVFVKDSLAYVADTWNGLQIIRVSNPTQPSIVGTYHTPSLAWRVLVQDSLAYVACYDSGLIILNVRDPAHPHRVGSFDTPTYAFGVFVQDSLAYVTDYLNGLYIIRVSNPAFPESVGRYDTPGQACGVFVKDTLAYVADWYGGLQIVRTRDAANPEWVSSYPAWCAYSVVVKDSLVYVGDWYGVHIIGVSDPAHPSLAGSYQTPGSSVVVYESAHAAHVFVQGKYAYVADFYSLIILSTTFPPPACDTLNLNEGWQWVSTNIDPDPSEMQNIFANCWDDLDIIIACDGSFCIPGVGCWIPGWNVSEMYKVHMADACAIPVCGSKVPTDTQIPLPEGWNCIAYFPECPLEPETALVSIWDNLDIVKNDQGQFCIPGIGCWIECMEYNEGYKLHLSSADTLVYPTSCPPCPLPFAKKNSFPGFAQTSHFNYLGNTGESYSIVVNSVELNGKYPEAGDEIGIFTPSGLCAGGGVWQGDILGIPAWQDDDRTEVLDGFQVGEQMVFKLWDKSKNKAIELSANLDKGDGRFGTDAYALVNLKGVSSQIPEKFELSQNYPNPFNPETRICYALPKDCHVKLTIYNLLGQKVEVLVDEHQTAGYKEVYWDGKDNEGKEVASGIYFYRIQAGEFAQSKKMVILK